METSTSALPPRRLLWAALAVTLALGVAAPVASASGDDVLRDCQAGALKAHYPPSDYRDALNSMPADADEYTDCRDQITAARLRDLPGGTSGISVGGSKSDVPRSVVPPAPDTADASDPGTATEFESAPADDTPAASEDGTPAAAGAPPTTGVTPSDVLSLTPVRGPAGTVADGRPRHLPLIPLVLVFSGVVLGLTRALVTWGRRAEPTPGA